MDGMCSMMGSHACITRAAFTREHWASVRRQAQDLLQGSGSLEDIPPVSTRASEPTVIVYESGALRPVAFEHHPEGWDGMKWELQSHIHRQLVSALGSPPAGLELPLCIQGSMMFNRLHPEPTGQGSPGVSLPSSPPHCTVKYCRYYQPNYQQVTVFIILCDH